MTEIDRVRKALTVSPELAKEIDDFRFEHRYKTDADVLRALIEAGLKSLKLVSVNAGV